MRKTELRKFESTLQDIVDRMQGDIASSIEQSRSINAGLGTSEMSNAPTHLGDLGTDEQLRDMNSVLVENATNLVNEALAALRRVRNGSFGRCESCGKEISHERLEVLPYARFCTQCAEKYEGGLLNVNTGRPQNPAATLANSDDAAIAAEESTKKLPRKRTPRERTDTHAAGTPGGGTAVGGLAGSPEGRGAPTSEDAMGSSDFDARTESAEDEDQPRTGHAGGAVGGTPAGKRAKAAAARRLKARRTKNDRS